MLWLIIVVAIIGAGGLAWFLRTQGRADDVAQGSTEPRQERRDGEHT